MKKYLLVFLLLPVFSQAQKVIHPHSGLSTSSDNSRSFHQVVIGMNVHTGGTGDLFGYAGSDYYNAVDLSYGKIVYDRDGIVTLNGHVGYLEYNRYRGGDGKGLTLGTSMYFREPGAFLIGGLSGELIAEANFVSKLPRAFVGGNLGWSLRVNPIIFDLYLGGDYFVGEPEPVGLHIGTSIRFLSF